MATQAAPHHDLSAAAYSYLVKVLNDPALKVQFWPKLTDEGTKSLAKAGFTTQDQQNELAQVLQLAVFGQVSNDEAFKEDKKRTEETFAIAKSMKDALVKNVSDTTGAYGRTMWMYIVLFYMGVAMIGFAIAFAYMGKAPLLPAVFGGLGTANSLAFLFTKPPERLQSSRASLAQLQCALLSWYNDLLSQQQMIQKLDIEKRLDTKTFQEFMNYHLEHTERYMKMLQEAVAQAHSKPVANKDGLVQRLTALRAAKPEPKDEQAQG